MNIRLVGPTFPVVAYRPQPYYAPGWYYIPSPVVAVFWVGTQRVERTIPAGWWELISVSGDRAQLATGGRGYAGQTSRFIVSPEILDGKEFRKSLDSLRTVS